MGLGECSGTGGEGAMGADTCLEEEGPCERLNGWDVSACPINTWLEATSMPQSSTGLACKAA